MNYLITGGAGFVGANLATFLRRCGHRVTVMDNLVRRGSEYNLPRLAVHGVRFLHGDVRNPEDFPVETDFDWLCECSAQPAATKGLTRPMYDLTNNTVGAFNAIEWCHKTNTGMVFWSTNKVYSAEFVNSWCAVEEGPTRWVSEDTISCGDGPDTGHDRSIYGASKLAAEVVLREYGSVFDIPVIINRCSCLAGPWQWGVADQGWVAWFVIAKHLNLPIKFFGWKGKQVRDVLDVYDLCDLILEQTSRCFNAPVQVQNVGGGPYQGFTLSPLELANMLNLPRVGAPPIPILEERYADHRYYVTDLRDTERLDWRPRVTVGRIVEDIDRWVSQHLVELKSILNV